MKIVQLKLLGLKLWQILALVSGFIIAVVMALASISYNSTLGRSDPAFALLPSVLKPCSKGLPLPSTLA